MIKRMQYTQIFYIFNRKIKQIFKKYYMKRKYCILKFIFKNGTSKIFFFKQWKKKISKNYDFKINIKWQLKKISKDIFSNKKKYQ